jgi:hypothetical protein
MNFLKSLFNRFKSDNNKNIYPARSLMLQFDIEAKNGSKFAEQFRDAVKSIEQKELDYSKSSINFVDSFLQKFHDENLKVDDFAETIFLAGCYVGEVFVRNENAKWVNASEIILPPGISPSSILIETSNKGYADPIVKSFKRFSLGDVESLFYFYGVFSVK